MIPPYPLAWPFAVPRSASKVAGTFKTTLNQAVANVEASLRKFANYSGTKVEGVVVTCNATLLERKPADCGVAVWFTWEGEQRCIAIDRYDKLEGNVQAIHHVLEARCVELRHGGLNVTRQTFKGFTALPAPEGWEPWQRVLGFREGSLITRAGVEAAYRGLAAEAHPDKAGGSHDAMARLNAARAAALSELPD